MRWILVLTLAASAAGQTQHALYACAVNAKAWVVGAKIHGSGLLKHTTPGGWEQLGFIHPMVAAADYDPREPTTLYIAAGNGLIRATKGGRRWRITTGWDVTELQDVSVDRNAPGTLYFSHTAGIRKSTDGGKSWEPADNGIHAKFCESLQVDRTRAGRVIAGTADGIYLTENGGTSWRRAGGEGLQVRRVGQSFHDPSQWFAGTQSAGLLRSRDSGRTWEAAGDVAVGQTLYDIAFDPSTPNRVALAGWGTGVVVSEDNGKTWERRSEGLPRWDIWSVAFDPGHPGRLYANVHEEALYVSEDAGKSWRKAGLEGSVVRRLHFFPEVTP